jgi:integrase
VPLLEPLAEVLQAQRRWLLETQHPGLCSGLVFPADPVGAVRGATRRDGELRWYRSDNCLDKPFRRICEAEDIPDLSPHALRRTMEDRLREAGVDQIVRQSIAGWSDSDTQRGYATVGAPDRAAAGDALVALILGPKGDSRGDHR